MTTWGVKRAYGWAETRGMPHGNGTGRKSQSRPRAAASIAKMQSILVTGGAGYIGSHVVRQLTERNERVVVLDNLSTGFRSAVLNAPLVVGDTGDRTLVDRVLAEHGIETVMHFAAHTIVPESVADPLKYYRNNTCATRNLLECCDRAGV